MSTQSDLPILAIWIDLDGTIFRTHLSEPLPQGFHPNLGTLSQFISYANEGAFPKIGFCTGRELNYFTGAALALERPNCLSILENGLYLYNLVTGERYNHPLLTQEIVEVFKEIKERFIPAITFRFPVLKEPLNSNKEVHISLERQIGHIDPATLVDPILEMLSEFADFVDVTSSSHAIDILVKGINKGSGMIEACNRMDPAISPQQVLVIGDSPNDFPAMELAGYIACPENASPWCKDFVRAKNGYVSDYRFVVGVVDAIEHYTSAYN